MRRDRSSWIFVAAILCTVAAAAGCTIQMPLLRVRYNKLKEETVESSKRFIEFNKIALISVDGFIGESSSLFSLTTSAADIKERLELARNDSRVKGVLLRINSPGGEVTTCDIIYNEIRAFADETHKPVVAYVMTVGASGGYYVAISADKIFMNPMTVTGSVGVIMEFTNAERLWSFIGLQSIAVKSGAKKDMGSPFRSIGPDEMAIFQKMNDEMFHGFLDKVQARRKLSEDAARTISDGRVLNGSEAVALGLADQTGEIKAAIDEVKRLAKIKDANVVAYTASSDYNTNVYASFASQEQGRPVAVDDVMKALVTAAGPRFLYLWAPGK